MKLIFFLFLLLSYSFSAQSGNLFLNKDSLLLENYKKIENYKKAAPTKKNRILLKEAYVARGGIYCNELDQYDSALFYLNRALENNLLELDACLYAKCLTEIGKVYEMTRRIDGAIIKYKEAITIQKEIKDTLGLIRALYQIGTSYYDYKRDSAFVFLNETKKLALNVGDKDYIAKSYRALGQFYLDAKKLDSAILYLNKALPILEQEQEYYDLCNLNLQFALLYSRSGKYNEAIVYAEKAKEVANKYAYLQLLKNVHDVLTEIYYHKGDCDKAIENLEAKHFIEDSMRSFKVQKNIEELTIQYDLVLKEEKNKQLQIEVKTVRLSKSNERFLFLVVLLIVLILSGIIYYMYVSKKRKLLVSDIERRLSEVKKKELSNRLDNAQTIILKKNKLIDRLKEDIEENVDNDERSKRLLDKLNTQNEWSEFMIEFEMLHADFFSKLNQSVNEPLTKNDIKLSALIRLNLSNKEISDLLYVSDAAVKKGKNRLAKKINLAQGEKLITYMNKL